MKKVKMKTNLTSVGLKSVFLRSHSTFKCQWPFKCFNNGEKINWTWFIDL